MTTASLKTITASNLGKPFLPTPGPTHSLTAISFGSKMLETLCKSYSPTQTDSQSSLP
jgi:hypothetical protein